MKAVLDEGVPRDLVRLLRREGCDLSPFPNEWKGTKNGRLLPLIRESGFDVLVTCDRSLRHQQNVGTAGIALVVLPAQRLEQLQPEVPRIADVLNNLARGAVVTMLPASQAK